MELASFSYFDLDLFWNQVKIKSIKVDKDTNRKINKTLRLDPFALIIYICYYITSRTGGTWLSGASDLPILLVVQLFLIRQTNKLTKTLKCAIILVKYHLINQIKQLFSFLLLIKIRLQYDIHQSFNLIILRLSISTSYSVILFKTYIQFLIDLH